MPAQSAFALFGLARALWQSPNRFAGSFAAAIQFSPQK